MIGFLRPVVDLVARVPARVQFKLLAAFLTIAGLLILVGAVGLQGLREVNERTEQLIKLQRKIDAYRQVQHDTTSQLYSVASALVSSDERALDSTLRQLNQFGYDVDRLEFVAKDEADFTEEHRQAAHEDRVRRSHRGARLLHHDVLDATRHLIVDDYRRAADNHAANAVSAADAHRRARMLVNDGAPRG